ncbi:hypothetical protein [Desulfovibrio ferrophilus]|uniref:UPF0371 protein HOLDEFILI_01188 n=1 Tax=Desulfovibrio ferrophilus TaxID=241368 RepID=A0A2Z6AZN2_9BACT|nr:hypothetical protein [Desulfovibrio ferrophilus]BBD08709.1 UPF0371 protein HOLDEFILI_01188 [Desulfovibrio ferrophilus]
MRWLISILISVAFAAGIILYYQMFIDFKAGQAEIEILNQEMQDYQKLAELYQDQEEQVVIVNALWNDIKEAKLEPDNWLSYPLTMGKTLEWRDVEKMMLLATNKDQDGNYWFRPNQLRISRVVVVPDKGTKGEDVETGTAPGSADLEQKNSIQMYDLDMSGTFLIPKTN